jgi:hypothetical protein
MNRTVLAAILATAGFVAVAGGPLAARPAPQDNLDRTETRAEALAQADRRFDQMDANKDGKLDSAEMTVRRQPPMAPGAMPPPPPPADGAAPPPLSRGDRMMARIDTNGDGMIDRNEFRAQAERRFDRMDANKDGKIDPAERQAARDAMGMRGDRGPGAGGDMPPPPPADAPKPDAGQ